MTASRQRPLRSVPFQDPARAFRLTLLPDARAVDNGYGLLLEETYGQGGDTLATHVVTASAAQAGRVVDAVLSSVRAAGHQPSVLSPHRAGPVWLDEAGGVRLALVLLTTQPLGRHDRVRLLVAGLNAMSVEETYYWYAKCLGPHATRARKALRILLSDA